MIRRADKPFSFADLPPASVAQHGVAPLSLRRGDGKTLELAGAHCAVMAILNLTPDSFSDGGDYLDPERAVARAEALAAAGAELIDLGAESTRPGATPLSVDEEWARLSPVLEPLGRRGLPAVLSVDTRHLEIAERAAAAGARLLNLTFPQDLPQQTPDPARLLSLFGSFDGVVVMHSRGDPRTMRDQTNYGEDLCQTVVDELRQTVASLLPAPGPGKSLEPRPWQLPWGDSAVSPLHARLIFDPGLGFAKTAEQSLALLSRLRWLRSALGGRLLIGASRKSMLGAITGLPIHERLIPSTVAAAFAAYAGADIVRVHDVAETLAAVRIGCALRKAEGARAW
jgi:dihydropteroate synthase